MATKLWCYVYCVQHWLCASYSPVSNPLWGGILFPCKRVAAFPFVGLRTTHLNTWSFDLSHCNDCIWAIYDWKYGGLTMRKWNCLSWYTAGNARDTLQYSGWNTIIAMSQFKQFLLKLRKCGTNNMNQSCYQNSVPWAQNVPKMRLRPGRSATDPTGGAYSAPQTP